MEDTDELTFHRHRNRGGGGRGGHGLPNHFSYHCNIYSNNLLTLKVLDCELEWFKRATYQTISFSHVVTTLFHI